MTVTVPAAGAEPWPVPPLFARLVDDTSLLRPRLTAPAVDTVVARYLAARDGRHGGLVGQLACPVSRLSTLVTELARAAPSRPVDVSLVVDTGLGAVPKALSTVFSRSGLLTPRTIETAAPPDVDAVWLERVAEFVPEDVVAVVEPLRPADSEPAGTARGSTPCAGWPTTAAPRSCAAAGRASDVPSVEDVEQFVRVVVEAGRGFTTLGLREVVRTDDGSAPAQHGILNLMVAVARALSDGDLHAALTSTDGEELAEEVEELSERSVQGVRGLLSRCGLDLEPGTRLEGLGLLA